MNSESSRILSYERNAPLKGSGQSGWAWVIALGSGFLGGVVLAVSIYYGGGLIFLLGSMILGFIVGMVAAIAVRRQPWKAAIAGNALAVFSVLSAIMLAQWQAERSVDGKLFLIGLFMAVLVVGFGLIGALAARHFRHLLAR